MELHPRTSKSLSRFLGYSPRALRPCEVKRAYENGFLEATKRARGEIEELRNWISVLEGQFRGWRFAALSYAHHYAHAVGDTSMPAFWMDPKSEIDKAKQETQALLERLKSDNSAP